MNRDEGAGQGHLENAAKLNDSSAAIHAMLASAHFYAGNLFKWIELCSQLAEYRLKEPRDFLFVAQTKFSTNPEAGIELIDSVYEEHASPLALSVRAELRAWAAAKSGSVEDALKALREIQAARMILGDTPYVLQVVIFAQQVALSVGREQVIAKTGLPLDPGETAKTLRTKFPEYPWGHAARAWYYESCGEYETAELAWREAGERTETPYFTTGLALLLYRMGRREEARKLVVDMESEVHKTMCATLLLDVEEGRLEGEQIYERAVSLAADNAGYRDSITLQIPMLLGNSERARRQAQEWVQEYEFRVDEGLGWRSWISIRIRFLAGESDEAEFFQRARIRKDCLCDAHSIVGTLHLANGEIEEARNQFEEAVETGVTWFFSYQLAEAFLGRIEEDPNWAHWVADGTRK